MNYPFGEYLQQNLSNVNGMAKIIKSLNQPDVLLCCRGSSGAMVSALVAQKMPKGTCKIAHFKKDGESAHHMSNASLFYDDPYIVIIDDFSITGETIKEIYKGIRKYTTKKIDCVCVDYISYELEFEVDVLIVGVYEE